MIQTDFGWSRTDDGVLSIAMSPPINITNWALQFTLWPRFGSSSGLVNRFANGLSGISNGQSGITFTNATQGRFDVRVNSVDTSGLDFKNFAYGVIRVDSGSRTTLSEGFLVLGP